MIQITFQLKDVFAANNFGGALAAAGIEFKLADKYCSAMVQPDDIMLVKELAIVNDINSATIHFE